MRGVMPLAYRLTTYRADGAAVRIGQRSDSMDQLLLAYGCRTATFVTAFNPFSRRMPTAWNGRMQARMAQAGRRVPMLPGDGFWRTWHEAHLLLLGDPRPAMRLARIFRQNAVVIVRLGQPGRLVSTS